jgi:hypothetical protein
MKTPSKTPVEVGGHDLLLSWEQKSLALSTMITSVITRFKKRKVYALMANHLQAPPIGPCGDLSFVLTSYLINQGNGSWDLYKSWYCGVLGCLY